MATPAQDLRYALRSLRRAPGFALVAALTLGLGVGANTAMVGLFDALLVRPPEGVRDPGSVVRVQAELALPGRPPALVDDLSYGQYEALRERAVGFAGIAASASTPLGVGEGEAVRNEPVILASGSYFPTLGPRAAAGRLLGPDDDREGAPAPVAVLSHDFWRRAYGSDPAVLGRAIRVGGQSLTIVGVAERDFVGTQLGAVSLWVPLSLAGSLGYDAAMMRSPFVSWLNVVGRLAPGASRERATATAQGALRAAEDERANAAPLRMGRGGATPGGARVEMRVGGGGPGGPGGPREPAPPPAPPRVRLAELRGAGLLGAPGPGGESGPPVQTWYLAVTAAVLLIACANVANLLLARGAYRAHELAVRAALGASGRRIARQLLVENAVLAALGAVAGLAVAAGVWRVLPSLISLPPLPPLLDPRILLVTAAIALLTVLLVGLAPMLGLRRPDLRSTMGAGGRSLAPRSRGRSALVVVQLAVSVTLLVGAGLFIRSFQNARGMDLGFDRERLLFVSADTRGAGWTPERAAQFWDDAAARAARIPGVRESAPAVAIPWMMRMMVPLRAEGEPPPANPAEVEPTGLNYVGAGWFEATGVRIEEGRAFNDADRRGSQPVAVVSRSFAREHFREGSPLGRCVLSPLGDECMRVVGVAADARWGELTDATPQFVYQPIDQRPAFAPAPGALAVRTTGAAEGVAAAVRRELQAAGGPQLEVRGVAEMLAPQLAPWRGSALLLGIFGGIGLLLAAVGLFGVVSFLVARRTREIGIRMALGATRGTVLGLVLGDAGRMVGLGALAGLLLAVAASRWFGSLLFGVGALDPLVYLAATATLALVALAAALHPARRASRVDPMVALRAE